MNKKRIIVLLAMLCLTLSSMTSMAAEISDNSSVECKYVTESDFEQIMSNSQNQIIPRVITCCDGSPSLAWQHTNTMHIYPNGGGLCLSLAYFGNQYCKKCGSIWQTNVCYKQTSTGCGSVHY